MKKSKEMMAVIFLLTFAVMVAVLGVRIFTGFLPQLSVKDICLQYERGGVLSKGSCACSEKLFKGNWNESYDWQDACYILKGKI